MPADGRRAARRDARRPRRLSRPRPRSPSATISPSAPTASTSSSPPSPEQDEAWSTNYDICRVPVAGGKVENLTEGQHGRRQRAAVLARRQVAGLSRPEAARLRGRPVGADGRCRRRRRQGQAAQRHRRVRSLGRRRSSGRRRRRRSTSPPSRTAATPIFRRVGRGRQARSTFISGGTQRLACRSARTASVLAFTRAAHATSPPEVMSASTPGGKAAAT